MAYSLRRLSRNEMGEAAIVHRKSFDQRLPWLAGMHTPAQDSDFFRDCVFAECELWGAVDGAVIGIIAFRAGWIDQLYILPDRQGQGAGSALLAIAKAAHGDLQLWTFQRNARARRFYEKRGFLAVLETDGSRNDEREPDMLYRWRRVEAVSCPTA